jgi:hypothetical protein
MVIGYILVKVNVISSSYKKYLNVAYYFFASIALIYLLVINWLAVDTFNHKFFKKQTRQLTTKDWKRDHGLMGLYISLYFIAVAIIYFICKAFGIIQQIIAIFYSFLIVIDIIVMLQSPPTQPPISEWLNDMLIIQHGLAVMISGLILNDIYKLCT